jgi:hypothetical protein
MCGEAHQAAIMMLLCWMMYCFCIICWVRQRQSSRNVEVL